MDISRVMTERELQQIRRSTILAKSFSRLFLCCIKMLFVIFGCQKQRKLHQNLAERGRLWPILKTFYDRNL